MIKKITGLPVIGLEKVDQEPGQLVITPFFNQARALVSAGADLLAVDVRQTRTFGEPLRQLLPRIKKQLRVPIVADCETLEDGEQALEVGVDALATTFAFKAGIWGTEPDFDLLENLTELGIPVLAEGGFWHPEQVGRAFQLGAWAVVVGTAITRPREITKRFVRACQHLSQDQR